MRQGDGPGKGPIICAIHSIRGCSGEKAIGLKVVETRRVITKFVIEKVVLDKRLNERGEEMVRTDRHKQNIYGPSMTTVESLTNCSIFGTAAIAALGLSKAAHEFLVLHYFATDSIVYWNAFLRELLPNLQLPDAFVVEQR